MSAAPDLGDLREQLDRLEVVLRDLGCPPMPRGLSPGEIEKLMSPFGHALPIEVSTLFEWHDGFGNWHPPMSAPISLEVAVARTVAKREEVEAAANSGLEIDPDVVWPRSWLMLCSEPALGVVVDCALPTGEPSPIMHPRLHRRGLLSPSGGALPDASREHVAASVRHRRLRMGPGQASSNPQRPAATRTSVEGDLLGADSPSDSPSKRSRCTAPDNNGVRAGEPALPISCGVDGHSRARMLRSCVDSLNCR